MAIAPVGIPQSGYSAVAAASFTVTLSTGTATAGDYDVIVCNVQGTGVSTATPSGWSLIAQCHDNSGVDNRTYGRFRQTGETSVTVSIIGGTSAYGWVSSSYRFVHETTPYGTATIINETSSSTTLPTAALTTTGTGSYEIVVAGIGSGSTSFNTAPAGTVAAIKALGGKRTMLAHAASPSARTILASDFTLSASARGGSAHFELFATATNASPLANAGPDQNVDPWETVILTGAGSSDPDGTIESWAWTQTSGTVVALSSTSVVSPTFEAPGLMAGDTLTFSLAVTDNSGATSSIDTVTVTVGAATEFMLSGGTWQPLKIKTV